MKRMAVVCLVAAGSLVMPQGAAGGGWWAYIDLNRDHLAVGQRFGLVSEHMFATIEAADRTVSGKDQFYAYLLEGYERERLRKAMGRADPGDWLRTKGALHLLGPVQLSEQDSNLVTAKAAFATPDVPPGRYDLMLCDEGCQTPMADAVPAAVWITTDLVAARAATKAQRISERLRDRAHALRSSNARLRKQVVSLKARVALIEEREVALAETVPTRVPVPPERVDRALLLAGGAVIGGATAMWLRRVLGKRRSVPA
ncbi:MAG: hypothetical protein ACR2KQ_04570 [Actinomycetota bacterium]